MACELLDPFELGSLPLIVGNGWSSTDGINLNTTFPRRNSENEGGLYALEVSVGAFAKSVTRTNIPGMREFYLRCGLRRTNLTSRIRVEMRSTDSQLSAEFATTGRVTLLRNGTVLQTSADVYNILQWYLCELHGFLDNASGVGQVRWDKQLILDYSGDTLGAANALCDTFYVEALNIAQIDDIHVNSISVAYDGGNGTAPVVGNTWTDTVSGAVGTISAVIGNGVSGRVLLYNWNGTPFGDNNAATATSGFAGSIHAPTPDYVNGLEPNSSWVGNGFVVYLRPASVGAYSELTGSPSATNWQNVDEAPVSVADYNEATVSGQKDAYGLQDLPASATAVSVAQQAGFMASELTGIDDYEFLFRYNGADYYSPVTPAASASNFEKYLYNTAPDGSGALTVAKINSAQHGVRFS